MPRQSSSGHSGFRLLDGAPGTIIKSAAPAMAGRLRAQYEKQRAFRVAHAMFLVGEVLEANTDAVSGDYSFTMRKYPYLGPVAFADRADAARVARTLDGILELVNEFIARSPITRVPRDRLVAKSEAVITKIGSTAWAPRFDEVVALHREALSRLPATIDIPVATCHGDLTLSNILFHPAVDAHVLIDFLDDYLESPLLDITKLRQEALLGWSSLTAELPHDRVKYRLLMQRFEENIVERLVRNRPWAPLIPVLTAQTLLRVVPYARNRNVVDALAAALPPLHREDLA